MSKKYTIDTSKIVLEEIIPSYAKFCEILNLEKKTDTKAKDKILDALHQAIEYDRPNTTKFIIKEIKQDFFIVEG